MSSRGVRGATTLNSNTKEEIKLATIELLSEMLNANDINKEDIAFAIFTTTKDINADFPAKYARIDCGFNEVPMMCYHELDVENSLKMCLISFCFLFVFIFKSILKHIFKLFSTSNS